MSKSYKVAVVVGSLRQASVNRKAAEAVMMIVTCYHRNRASILLHHCKTHVLSVLG